MILCGNSLHDISPPEGTEFRLALWLPGPGGGSRCGFSAPWAARDFGGGGGQESPVDFLAHDPGAGL